MTGTESNRQLIDLRLVIALSRLLVAIAPHRQLLERRCQCQSRSAVRRGLECLDGLLDLHAFRGRLGLAAEAGHRERDARKLLQCPERVELGIVQRDFAGATTRAHQRTHEDVGPALEGDS